MILADKRRPGEIAEVKRLDLGGVDPGVRHRLLTGFDGERTEIAIGKGPERSFSDADNGYWSHIFRIAPEEDST